MNEDNIFEQASRMKLRFVTSRGEISAEDLWDLPLTSSPGALSLDDLARGLHTRMKNELEVSFVKKPRPESRILALSFNIAKHVIDTLLAEADANEERVVNASRRSRVKEIIAQKQDQELLDLPLEELQKMAEA